MSLDALLKNRIARHGPISVAEYMRECLMHPQHGYYVCGTPFGAEGDFITAPEISQMFGEIVGLCLAQTWLDQGRPTPFTLAELGPGRGTMMRDILKAASKVEGFIDAAEICLFEASPVLRREQRNLLCDAVTHLDTVDGLPEQPLLLVANEFFDALPMNQYVRGKRHWLERQVGLEDGKLTFGLGPELPQPALASRLLDTAPGDLVETSPAAAPVVAALSERIEAFGGAALIIDYGDWRSFGDTLQAVRAHQKTDPLAHPGEADLTAHVDFEALAMASRAAHSKLCSQGVFLERLGITARAQKLAEGLTGQALDTHIAAHRRLTHPDEMGNLFKVLGLYQTRGTPPPGLDA